MTVNIIATTPSKARMWFAILFSSECNSLRSSCTTLLAFHRSVVYGMSQRAQRGQRDRKGPFNA